jgi:trehalose-6-phosphatase
MSAEHGSFVKGPVEEDFINMTESLDMSWMSEVEEIFRYYMEVSNAMIRGLRVGSLIAPRL